MYHSLYSGFSLCLILLFAFKAVLESNLSFAGSTATEHDSSARAARVGQVGGARRVSVVRRKSVVDAENPWRDEVCRHACLLLLKSNPVYH